jgi:hypothetical protein
MKNNRFFILGMLAVLLTFGLVLAGCDNDTTDDDDKTGTLTITGLDSINGKYVRATGTINGKTVLSMDSSGNQFFLVDGGKVTVSLRDMTGLSGTINTIPPAFTETGTGEFNFFSADDVTGTSMQRDPSGPYKIPLTNGSGKYFWTN